MFNNLSPIEKDPVFKLFDAFKADTNPNKINLGIGLFFDKQGRPVVFDSVKKAVTELDVDNFNYQPIGGNRDFLELAGEFVFEKEYDVDAIAMQATCGGTQACSLFSKIVQKSDAVPVIQIGTPCWGNYFALFKDLEIETFDHLDEAGGINYEAHLKAVKEAPDKSIFLLQGTKAHNPSGLNLSLEQMKNLIDVLREKNMFLFMDLAYFGFSEGLTEDCKYVDLCFDNLDNFALGLSFSKNASLYEHRCGALFVKTQNKDAVEGNLQQAVRESISVPPGFGQELMINVLKNYRESWEAEIESARLSIDSRRSQLLELLPKRFQSLKENHGMFGILPLEKVQIKELREKHGIYLLENGRINFAGMKVDDIPYIADKISSL